MADNVVTNPGVGGATFASDDIGGIQYPRVKVTYGDDGISIDASATNPLPVALSAAQIAALQAVTGPLTDAQLRATPVPVSGTFFQATQPVSVGSLPLPALAATSTIQTDRTQKTQITDGTRDGTVKAASTLPLATDTAFVVTQRDALPAGANAIGSITNTSFIATQATPANLQMSATQVVGSAATRWFAQISDGTNSPAIKAASVAAAFTDPALTIDARPGGALVTAAAALADAFANPTVGQRAVLNGVFNGSTWDRQRGMGIATTTGDTGAKTATGNGATQTNVGNKGVQIVLNMGAVTGTTPTFVLKVQSSVDGGTNWVDVPGAVTASITATGIYGILIYPGIAITAGVATTGTTATANMAMPRTWRVVWTIGGTTPSFTITSITYNYIPN